MSAASPIAEAGAASWLPGPFPSSSLASWVSVISILWLSSIGHGLSAAPAPFLQLRETTLGYHGSTADFTNLTEIRVGWFGPTDVDDPLTGDLWWAANLAFREANAQNAECGPRTAEPRPSVLRPPTSDLRSLPFRLIPRWSIDPWGSGVSQLTRMVYDEQPLALIGSVDSAATHLAEQVVAKANLALVSPITTDKSVTLAGVSWMFSCAPSDDAIARVLVDGVLTALDEGVPYAARSGSSAERRHFAAPSDEVRRAAETPLWQPGIPGTGRSLALLACTDHESRMTAREVLRELSRRGRMPDLRLDVTSGTREVSLQLARLAESDPGVLLIIAGAGDSARLVRAVRARFPGTPSSPPASSSSDSLAGKAAGGPGPLIFGSHSMGRARFRELAGPAAEGVRFPLLVAADPNDPDYSRFASRFRAERGRAPDYTAVLTYDATRLVIETIHRSGPNRGRIRETLTQLSPWPGLAGPIQFDGTGQNIRTNICLGTIRDGTVVAVPGPPSSADPATNTARL